MPKGGGCDPVGSPCCSRLLAGPVILWREEHWSRSAGRICDSVEGIHTEAVNEELEIHGEDLEEVTESCLPWVGCHT